MIKKILFLFIFFSINTLAQTLSKTTQVEACTVELFSKVYRLESNQTLTIGDVIHKTNCGNAVSSKISQLISNSSGSIGADFLKRELVNDFSTLAIEIKPRKLSIMELNPTFRDQLTNSSNFYFFNSKSLNGISTIGLAEGEQLQVSCESCNSCGEKNIKLTITNSLQSPSKTLWFSTTIMAKIKILKAKRSLSLQEKHLEIEDFYADEIYTSTPDNVLTSLDNIIFYKINKNILQGSVISNLDLQAVNLVNYGTPVRVVLKNQNINLQRIAMPLRSAIFGEVIELKNPSNNKIIAGKVVDYNKVVIEI
jgi:flagella basal body P-ring formation protein FlgA